MEIKCFFKITAEDFFKTLWKSDLQNTEVRFAVEPTPAKTFDPSVLPFTDTELK